MRKKDSSAHDNIYKNQLTWLKEESIVAISSSSYLELMNRNDIHELFRLEAASAYLQFSEFIPSLGWEYILKISQKKNKLMGTWKKLENHKEGLWEYISNETKVSISNLWHVEALENLMDAISYYEKSAYNIAWVKLLHGRHFSSRVIGHEGGELKEFHTKVIQGASKGGAALHKDNVPFKEAYREARDAEQNKGKTRVEIIDMVYMSFDALLSSIQTWAKDADDEDGFKRKGGRPPKKKG